MAITREYTAGATGTSCTLNIGTAGNNRLVVVFTNDESTNQLTGVTVDGKSCTKIAHAANSVSGTNISEMWYILEATLGSSNGSVTVAITGGDTGYGVHAATFYGVDQAAPGEYQIEDQAVDPASTISIENQDCPANGLVCMVAGHGLTDAFSSWTSPLTTIDTSNPTSAIMASGSGIESSAQSNKTYVCTFAASFNRGSGITASWSEASTGGSYDQTSFRGYDDDAVEGSATAKAAANTNFSQIPDINFRIRFLVQEDDDVAEDDVSFQLQYNLDSGGWNDVNASSSVVRSSASSYITDGGNTTQQIGSGTFVTPNAGFDEVNGLAGGTSLDFTTTVNQEVEVEYCVQIRDVDTSTSDTIQLRLIKDTAALDTYTNTPTVTVLAVPTYSYTQASFRGRNDDGSETAATWIAALNTNFTQDVDTNFRIRFLIQETEDVADANVQFQLQYNYEGGGWNDVNGSSSVVRSFASSEFTDGDDTTQQLGSGTFISNNDCMDEANGLVGGANLDFTATANQEVEAEFCIQIRDADTSGGDTIQLRLIKEADEALTTYTNTPTITVPNAPAITTVGGDNQFHAEEEDVEIVGTDFYASQGTGKVELCPSSTYGSAVEQTVATWSDLSIEFDVVQGSLSLGTNYVFVTNSDGLRNATGHTVTITAAPISTGLWQTASIQTTIGSAGIDIIVLLVSDE